MMTLDSNFFEQYMWYILGAIAFAFGIGLLVLYFYLDMVRSRKQKRW